MNCVVLSYHPQPYGDYQLGFCKVDVGGKCSMILKVVKSKAGNVYCAFASTKIDEEWLPTFSFSDKDYERNFLNECKEQLKPLMQSTKQEQPPQDQPGYEAPPAAASEGMPF